MVPNAARFPNLSPNDLHRIEDVPRNDVDVAVIACVEVVKRVRVHERVVGTKEPRTMPYGTRPEPGAGSVGGGCVERDSHEDCLDVSEVLRDGKSPKGRELRESWRL